MSLKVIWNRCRSWCLAWNNRENEHQELELNSVRFWESPLMVIVPFNAIFWSIAYLELRPYSLFFMAILFGTACHLAIKNGCPLGFQENSELQQGWRRFSNCAKMMWVDFKELRRNEPGALCLIVCSCCLGISFLGRCFSGLLLLYLLLTFLMVLPIVLRFAASNAKGSDDDDDVEEYLPEPTTDVIQVLNMAGGEGLLDSARTEMSEASICSLYPDLCEMPWKEPSCEILEEDIEIRSPRQMDVNYYESESSENSDVQLKGSNFNGSSSGSEEEEFNFARGLKAHGAQMLASLVSNREESDSDSFEIISKDEL